ncbi:sugar-binding domain-containing protein [Gorillibacterium sp. CAU 1737]|uniref:sugar-binding transcriptional regulator n=1 Tax=Gorillibacterium sp. CAU 1737 TaxID=3140362 RepID=UPI003260BAF0
MRAVLEMQKQLVPDVLDIVKKRYTILHYVLIYRLVGRRTLAASLNMTERVLRAEVDFLKEQGLLEVESFGMRVTPQGKQLLSEMEPMIKDLFGYSRMEEALKEKFSLRDAIVVPGDSDESDYTKKEMGRAAATALRKAVTEETVIAVTGGSTLAEVAAQLTPSSALKGSLFVPARGGIGESVEFQANTLASVMAKKTGGQYRLLHVPDHLGEDAYHSLIQEPNIREILDVIKSARILLHGIGEATVMAKRRKVETATLAELTRTGARGEAFGYYFDQSGQVVYKMPTLGLKMEDLKQVDTLIAVAGGSSKGGSIAAVLRQGLEHILVTDEAAARYILQET